MRQYYDETMQESSIECKKRERWVLDKAISLLSTANQSAPDSKEVVEALFYTTRVWVVFIQDLISENNQLSEETKINLISVGLWILKECERIRRNQSNNYQEIIDIITIVRDGLK
ncbi:flagellar biosynthesis regulator FlaF [Candidatus Liberibacter africanus]|uniref:Flagellar biosynthesis regulatory protein FlaF n=1 Tax=Candidatus Liberibacter africanus PTSAPSY TaxID=1277257 RepID=A0A0G3I3G2_LIBAF|nr:flagellar biosynthesis regulator FlaF [Candidatus Liberibacter africanus]AKK20379.1 flagellar biosynthesis regulatory protein FlaF [Candidatus Liberibacter africanus PTSAPSY]QTP64115.1 flagellar biosynthesis regulator FlaF [Candidatus Liberibacter africanus]